MDMPAEEAAPRSQGPEVIHSGGDGAALLVLDPAGAGRHGMPPASWADVGSAVQVIWLRLPAVDEPVNAARTVLDRLHNSGSRVHLVASGEACPLAQLLALERPARVRSLLLVDPAGIDGPAGTGELGRLVERGGTVVDRALLAGRSQSASQTLAGRDIRVRMITSSEDDRAGHEPPLPLGHPAVVAAVRESLTGDTAAAAAATAHPSRRQPAPSPRPARPGLLRRLWRRVRGG